MVASNPFPIRWRIVNQESITIMKHHLGTYLSFRTALTRIHRKQTRIHASPQRIESQKMQSRPDFDSVYIPQRIPSSLILSNKNIIDSGTATGESRIENQTTTTRTQIHHDRISPFILNIPFPTPPSQTHLPIFICLEQNLQSPIDQQIKTLKREFPIGIFIPRIIVRDCLGRMGKTKGFHSGVGSVSFFVGWTEGLGDYRLSDMAKVITVLFVQ
ncbi:hypothetical protein ACHAXS_006978 [Conticribra weissflogii]